LSHFSLTNNTSIFEKFSVSHKSVTINAFFDTKSEKEQKRNEIECLKSFDSNSISNSFQFKERQVMETKLNKDNNEESVFGEQILKFFNYFNTNYLFLLSI